MKVELLPITSITPYARNPRVNTGIPVSKVKASLKEFGWQQPIVVDKDMTIVVGHTRYMAALELGMTEVPVHVADNLTPTQIKAYRIADNRIGSEAQWDMELLNLEIQDLKELDFDLDLTGFDADELAGIELDSEPDSEGDTEPQTDRAEELRVQWGVEYGDLWALGEHRLLCGDSTKADDVGRVMDGEKAELVVTDPPYGVSYADKNSFLNAIDKGNRIQTEIKNDHLDKEQTQELWKSAFCEMSKAMDKGAVVYCFMPQGGDQMMMMMMMGAGIEPRHELIWLKNNHVLGRTDYAYKHEPILYAWKEGGHHFYGDFQTSILEYPRPQKADMHPTMKPVELVMKLVENSSHPGGILYEPFSGSGTTIIAAENLKRKARAIEISPAYVAVALQRWADHTGKTPTLIPNGP
jgi:DNA modification methylase